MLSMKDSVTFYPALLTILKRFVKSTTSMIEDVKNFVFNQIENSPVGQRAIVGEVKQEIFVPVDGAGEDRLLVAK